MAFNTVTSDCFQKIVLFSICLTIIY